MGVTGVFIVTLAAASAEWTDPCASAAGLARAWAAAGQAVAVLDTAPRVHRVGPALGVGPCAGVDELLMELELAAPGNVPRIRVAEAEGWSERGSRLKQVWRGLERAGIGAVLVCCTVEQGGWLRELLAASQRLVLVSGPRTDHAHDLVRLVPLSETPRELLIAADGPLPARGQPEHPERVAAAARLPLAAALDPDTAEAALADFARRLLAELAPAPAVTNPPSAPAAAADPPAVAAALPREAPDAEGAMPVLVPDEARAAVSALLALWPLRSRVAELDPQVAAAGAAVHDLTSDLQQGLLAAGTDPNRLARHFDGVMRAREELARLRVQRQELEQAYRAQVEAFCRQLDLPPSAIGGGQGHHAGTQDVHQAVVR